MKSSQVAASIKADINAGISTMIWGSPGVGKSDLVRQVAEETGRTLIDIRLSQIDPVDLRGIPVANREARVTEWLSAGFLPRHGSGPGLVFLDEINSAPQATAAAAYQLVLDGKLGEYTLPSNWAVIAAGNRASDRAIVNQMSSALKNRFHHIKYEVNHDDWCLWALKNELSTEVLSFIRFRPTLLNEFETRNDSKQEKDRQSKIRDAEAFATPRTWEFVSDHLKAGVPTEIEFEHFAGDVGEGPATEFLAFMKYHRQLPNLDNLLLNPISAAIPTEPAVLYALATGLAARATVDNFDRVTKYLDRLPGQEFAVMCVKDAILRANEISNTKAFNVWVTAHSDLLN